MSNKFMNLSGYPEVINNKKIKYIEEICEKWATNFGAKPITIPMVEKKEIFERSVGNNTDIVEKEMLTLKDGSLVLRPEGTSGIIRAWNNNGGLRNLKPTKWFYNDYMFRNETPQSGRFKQFKQFGIECLGYNQGMIDLDILVSIVELFKTLKIENKVILKINTIGTIKEREEYIKILKIWLYKNIDLLDDLSISRIENNPLRIFDTKIEKTKNLLRESPKLYDNLLNESKIFFENIVNNLKELNINFEIDYNLVRGLDYYNGIVFEFISKDKISQNTIAAGGRYDDLSKKIGGEKVSAIGFALGLERLSMLIKEKENSRNGFYICWNSKKISPIILVAQKYRKKECVEIDIGNRKLSKQISCASEKNFKYAIIIDNNELLGNFLTIKNLENGLEEKVNFKF